MTRLLFLQGQFVIRALFPGGHRCTIGSSRWITCKPSSSILDDHRDGGLMIQIVMCNLSSLFSSHLGYGCLNMKWNCYVFICCQASAEHIDEAGGQEVQIEAVQVMVGHQKVSFGQIWCTFLRLFCHRSLLWMSTSKILEWSLQTRNLCQRYNSP